MFPVLSQLQTDKDRLGDVYRKYLKVSAMIIFFVMFTLVALAKPAVGFLVSDKWLPCVPYLRILCFAYMFDFICSINLSLLQVIGRSDLFLRLEIIKKSLSLTMLFISAQFGITAMCISSVIYTQIAIAINTYYTGRIFNFGYWEQVKDYLPYFMISLIISIPSYFLTLIPVSYFLQLLISGIVAVILFLFFMRIRKDEMYLMVEDMVKNRFLSGA
jgi:O-antigen/teichoic acid export membrane protein